MGKIFAICLMTLVITFDSYANEVECKNFSKAYLGAVTENFEYECRESLEADVPPVCEDFSNSFEKITQIRLQKIGVGVDTGLEIKLLRERPLLEPEVVFSRILSSYGENPNMGESLVCSESIDINGNEYRSLKLSYENEPIKNTYTVSLHNNRFTVFISLQAFGSLVEHQFTFER